MHKKSEEQKHEHYKTLRGTQKEVEDWELAAMKKEVTFGKWARAWLNWAAEQDMKLPEPSSKK